MLNISVLSGNYSICKFKSENEIPRWIYSSDFYSITKTQDEISVVAPQAEFAEEIICNRDWRVLKIAGPLAFALTGIIAGLSTILKDRNIPVFVISTYDTDYILIKQNDLINGIAALEEKGHKITTI